MSERRLNPTTGEWVEFATPARPPSPPGACALCQLGAGLAPGGVAVIDDTPAAAAPPSGAPPSGLYRAEPAGGAAETVVYAPDHDTTLAGIGPDGVRRVVEVWADRYAELGGREDVGYVLAYEDAGEPGGRYGGHPHGHVRAYPEAPPLARLELEAAARHLRRTGRCLYCDVVRAEQADPRRVVAENRSFVAVVPFWARQPFEAHLLSRRHATGLLDLTDPERSALAALLHACLAGYGRLPGQPGSYRLAVHAAPTDDGEHLGVSHLHVELAPAAVEATERDPHLAAAEPGTGVATGAVLPEAAAASFRAALQRSNTMQTLPDSPASATR